jgi:hypothetical protein
MRKKVLFLLPLFLFTSLPVSQAADKTIKTPTGFELYDAKTYNYYNQRTSKICQKLKSSKLNQCIFDEINRNPKVLTLRRTIMIDTASKILAGNANTLIRDIRAISAVSGNFGSPTLKDYQTAIKNYKGVAKLSFDPKLLTVTLSLESREEGKIILTQKLLITNIKDKPTISGLDALGRKF